MLRVPARSALGEFAVEQLSQDSEVVHPDDMFSPSKLGFENHGFIAGSPCRLQNFQVSDPVLPADVKGRP